MGLTIHCRLTLRSQAPELDSLRARRVVEEARQLAVKMMRDREFEGVDALSWDALARGRAADWLPLPVPGEPDTSTGVEIAPIEGHIFRIDVGLDCEPLWIGLCRYPAQVQAGEQQLRMPRGTAWRLASSCKTQYASLHGWEHIRRCHMAIVDFSCFASTAGIQRENFR